MTRTNATLTPVAREMRKANRFFTSVDVDAGSMDHFDDYRVARVSGSAETIDGAAILFDLYLSVDDQGRAYEWIECTEFPALAEERAEAETSDASNLTRSTCKRTTSISRSSMPR